MSLKFTLSTQNWKNIPKKCKSCTKAIYTLEDREVYYQCSAFGKFKRDCELELDKRELPKPEQILKVESE